MPASFVRSPLWLLPWLASLPAQAQTSADAATLQPMVVTATRSERALDETPIRTEVVSRQEIERTHARTLRQALENVPGLQMREVIGKSGYELSLQGLGADQVLVLIDGLPITASTSSTVDLNQYLLTDVEHIEIVKGASSAQYGSSAMGGVINVITRRTQAGFGGTAALDIGSHGQQNDSGQALRANNHHARFALGGGGTHWRLSLSGDLVDDAGFGIDPALHARQGDASQRRQLSTRAEWLPQAAGRAWAELSHYSEDDHQRFLRFIPPHNLPQNKREDIRRERASAGIDWRFDNGLRAQVQGLNERYTSRSDGFSNAALATARQARMQTQHLGTQLDLPAWGRQLWILGTDWRRETLAQTSNGLAELQGAGNATRTSAEIFVQNDILLSERWELLLGLRGQNDSDFGSHWAPKLSLRGNLWDSDGWKGMLRASVGQGYRVPNLKERHFLFDHSALGYRVVGNPLLKPESSTSWQLGASLAQDQRLTLELNAFHNQVRDLIQTDLAHASSANGVTSYSYANVARARTSGMEWSSRWRASPSWELSAAYTLTLTRDQTTDLELTRRPRHMARLGADWQLQPNTTLSLRARWQGNELADTISRARSQAWTTLDLALNHRIGQAATLFAGVNNLTGRQRDFSAPSDFGPIAGRVLYLGAQLAFGNTL